MEVVDRKNHTVSGHTRRRRPGGGTAEGACDRPDPPLLRAPPTGRRRAVAVFCEENGKGDEVTADRGHVRRAKPEPPLCDALLVGLCHKEGLVLGLVGKLENLRTRVLVARGVLS